MSHRLISGDLIFARSRLDNGAGSNRETPQCDRDEDPAAYQVVGCELCTPSSLIRVRRSAVVVREFEVPSSILQLVESHSVIRARLRTSSSRILRRLQRAPNNQL